MKISSFIIRDFNSNKLQMNKCLHTSSNKNSFYYCTVIIISSLIMRSQRQTTSQQLPPKILPLFDALRIPSSKYPFSSLPASRHALNPLLVPTTATSFSSPQSQFIFEQYKYTTLGNAVIQRAITKEVTKFFLLRNTPLSASPNATRQLISCFHNSLSVRFVAESLPLAPAVEVSSSSSSSSSTESKKNTNFSLLSLQQILDSAKPAESSPSRADKKGTSFDWAPFGYAQSDHGPRLTHFLGCIELYCGREVALEAARRAFFDLDGETSNLPYEAAQLLATLSKKYNPQNVSMALLAAQGLNGRFFSRSVVVKMKNRNDNDNNYTKKSQTSFSSSKEENGAQSTEDESLSSSKATASPNQQEGAESSSLEEHEAKLDDDAFGSDESDDGSDRAIQKQTADNTESIIDSENTNNIYSSISQSTPPERKTVPPSSHVSGPPRLNMMKKWETRVLNKASTETADENSSSSIESVFGGTGWNSSSTTTQTETAQWPHRTTQQVIETNADRNGIPDIISNIQHVNRKIQNRPVVDPAYFDKNDGKDGVEFSNQELSAVVGFNSNSSNNSAALATLGSQDQQVNPMSPKGIINTLTRPHDRLFEVSFVRDPIIDSTRFRREVYATDVPHDQGRGKSISDITKSGLFGDDRSIGDDDSNDVKKSQKVGPKMLAKGIGKSFGEARSAASMNYLQGVISDLSVI